MKPWFTGEEEPPRRRVTHLPEVHPHRATSKTSARPRATAPISEMLGNFSFGDYFKKEAIPLGVGISDQPRMGRSRCRTGCIRPSFAGNETTPADDEAFRIWNEEIGIPAERIFQFGKEDNFWEHGSGPCGPCSEIYYDRGEQYGCGKPGCTVGCDCDRYVEVWNDGVLAVRQRRARSLHRAQAEKHRHRHGVWSVLLCVCQGVDSLFDVDTVMNITNKVSELTGVHYGQSHKKPMSPCVLSPTISARRRS